MCKNNTETGDSIQTMFTDFMVNCRSDANRYACFAVEINNMTTKMMGCLCLLNENH